MNDPSQETTAFAMSDIDNFTADFSYGVSDDDDGLDYAEVAYLLEGDDPEMVQNGSSTQPEVGRENVIIKMEGEQLVKNTGDHGTATAKKAARSTAVSKKRKFNPDAEAIARTTDETLRSMDVDPDSKEGKRKRRQIRNRLSAQFHRDRKNSHITSLEAAIAEKDCLIRKLQEQIVQLEIENKRLSASTQANSSSLLDSFQQLFPQYFIGSNRLSGVQYDHSYGTDSEDLRSLSSISATRAKSAGSDTISHSSTNTTSPTDSPHHGGISDRIETDSNRVEAIGNSGSHSPVGISLPAGLTRPLTFMSMICMISIMLISQQQQIQRHVSTNHFSRLMNPAVVDFLSKQFHSLNIQHPAREHLLVSRYHADGSLPFAVQPLSNPPENSFADEDSAAVTHGRRLQTATTNVNNQFVEDNHDMAIDSDEHNHDSTAESITSLQKKAIALPSTSPIHHASKTDVVPTKTLELRSSSQTTGNGIILHSTGERVWSHGARSRLDNIMGVERSHFLLTYTNGSIPGALLKSGRKFHLRGTAFPKSATFGNHSTSEVSSFTHRKLVLSGGLVSRSMVDTAFLTTGTSLTAYYPPSTLASAHQRRPSTVALGFGDGAVPHDRGSDDMWQDSITVSSYSSMIMTEGKVLLDPTLRLGTTLFREYEPNATDSNYHSMPSTNPLQSSSAHSSAERNVALINHVAPAAQALTQNAGTLPQNAETKAIVATGALAPQIGAVPQSSYQESYFNNDEEGSMQTKNLLGDANVMTIKLPASSIRLGSSWGESTNGTVEHIMRAFNITSPPVPPKTLYSDDEVGEYSEEVHYATQSIMQNYSADDAAVEINCLILGAKLVLSDPTSTG